MSRESLLDDAIAEAKRIEDWQLVEWLRMARGSESAARWYTEQLRAYKSQCAVLAVENAKLRDLVRDMWPHVRHRSKMCDACDLDCSTSSECLLYKPMRDRMRELGVEVDE